VSLLSLSDAATLFHQDCREALKTLADNSLDSCVTDPPYALVSTVKRFGSANAAPAQHGTDGAFARASAGFMGQKWDTGETAFSTEFWQQVYRVLKPGAFVAAFGASRQYHRMACAIEAAGFEIRDSLMWVYGTGFPKSHDVSKGIDREAGAVREVVGEGEPFGRGSMRNKTRVESGYRPTELNPEGGVSQITTPATPQAAEWEGWGTALKPAFEPIVLARKPLSEGTVAANVLRWRTGALNIGASRVPSPDGVARVQHHKTGAESMFSGINGGTLVDPSFDGRWPANVVHDGSDEVVGAFPSAGGQQGRAKIGGAKAGKIYGDFGENFSSNPEPRNDSGSAARFFYSAKASKADRAGSKHPTVKPIALMEWLCTLITPPGGTILDPFAGSGTTGIAATRKGFSVLLCEREEEYVQDIRSRFGSRPVLDMSALLADATLLPALRELQVRLACS
jgi:DNA modification methylase